MAFRLEFSVEAERDFGLIFDHLVRSAPTGALSSVSRKATPSMSTTSITTREAVPMLMHNPPHPGAFIRRQCLEPLGLTVTEAAKGLAVSRNTLSMLLNGRLGISSEMAIRLSQAFGGSPESWLQQQLQYDLWHTQRQRDEVPVRRFVAA